MLDFIEHGEHQSKASPERENVVVRVAEQISLDKLMERCRFACPASRVAAALGFLATAGVSSGVLPDPTEQIYKVPTSVSVGKRYVLCLLVLSIHLFHCRTVIATKGVCAMCLSACCVPCHPYPLKHLP